MKITKNIMKSSICLIPWISSSLHSGGQIRLCCIPDIDVTLQDENHKRCNISTHGVHDGRNCELIKKIRLDFLNGIKPEICNICWNKEKLGNPTKRIGLLHLYKYFKYDIFKDTNSDGSIDVNKFPIMHYDLRFGNLCNAKCMTCGSPIASTFGTYIEWSDNKYNQDLTNSIDSIKEIYFAGGEPLINKYHWDFIKLLVKKNKAKDIYIKVITNGSTMKEEYIDLWKEFKKVRVMFSIDGINETFEKIRIPLSWEKVEKNLIVFDKLTADKSNIESMICPTISILNVFKIPELHNWLLDRKFKTINNRLLINFLYNPEKYTVKNKIDIYDEVYKIYEPYLNGIYKQYFQSILRFIKGDIYE